MDSEDKDVERLKAATASLGEHFDSVQIFCTRHESGEMDGTLKVKDGAGNWYARYGQIQEWLLIEEERARIQIRKDME